MGPAPTIARRLKRSYSEEDDALFLTHGRFLLSFSTSQWEEFASKRFPNRDPRTVRRYMATVVERKRQGKFPHKSAPELNPALPQQSQHLLWQQLPWAPSEIPNMLASCPAMTTSNAVFSPGSAPSFNPNGEILRFIERSINCADTTVTQRFFPLKETSSIKATQLLPFPYPLRMNEFQVHQEKWSSLMSGSCVLISAHNLSPHADPVADGLLKELRMQSLNIRAARLAKLQEEVASLAKMSFVKVHEPVNFVPAHIRCVPTIYDVPRDSLTARVPGSTRKRRNRIARAQAQSPLGRKMHSQARVKKDPSSLLSKLDTSTTLNSCEIAGLSLRGECVSESAAQGLLALSLQSSASVEYLA